MARKQDIPRNSIASNPKTSEPAEVANDHWSGDAPSVVALSSSSAKARFKDLELLPQIRSEWTAETVIQWLEIYAISAHERRRKIDASPDSNRQTGGTVKRLRKLVKKWAVPADPEAVRYRVWRARYLVQRGFEIDEDTISDALDILPEEAAKLTCLKAARKYR
ncbi:MAG: hypothetical protein ABI972_16605 [Acidobacteriota bacterium]